MKKSLHAAIRIHLRASAFLSALLVFALVLRSGAAFAADALTDDIASDDPTVVGSDISGMNCTDIYGGSVSGAVFSERGLTVLHYFSTWSQDCIREMGYMQSALDSFGANELAVYGLLHEDAASTVEACVQLFSQLSLSYGCLRLDSVLTSLVSNYPFIPQTFFVNQSGIVVAHFPGTFESYEQLYEMIEQYLGHPALFHSVSFIDGLNGALISRVTVPHGGNAVPPAPPVHPGYEFLHWDGSYQNVTENRTIVAVYMISGGQFQQGDVNGDGSVTFTDALMTLRHALQLSQYSGVETYGDVNGDGIISVSDAVMIMRHSLGLISL